MENWMNMSIVNLKCLKGSKSIICQMLCLAMLLRTLYGMIQAAYAFWTTFLNAMWHMKYNRSKADPCLYYHWTKTGLVLWLSWVDDCLVCGH
jgi:hypothetical protein